MSALKTAGIVILVVVIGLISLGIVGYWFISNVPTGRVTETQPKETTTTLPPTTSTTTTTTTPPRGGIYFKGETSIIPAGFPGSYYIIGELLNNGTWSYKNYQIQIVADLYKGEKLVDTVFGFPTTDLPAGGTASFKIIVFNAPDFDSYKLKVSV